MPNPSRSGNRVLEALRTIIPAVQATQSAPIVVALDGASGAGKSTIATALAALLRATVVPSDDFFAAQITLKRGMLHSLIVR